MKNITDKLQSRGAQALTDEELVAVALAENPNDDSACAMAEEVLKTSGGSLVRLAEAELIIPGAIVVLESGTEEISESDARLSDFEFVKSTSYGKKTAVNVLIYRGKGE